MVRSLDLEGHFNNTKMYQGYLVFHLETNYCHKKSYIFWTFSSAPSVWKKKIQNILEVECSWIFPRPDLPCTVWEGHKIELYFSLLLQCNVVISMDLQNVVHLHSRLNKVMMQEKKINLPNFFRWGGGYHHFIQSCFLLQPNAVKAP
jgi:hypothetical protein